MGKKVKKGRINDRKGEWGEKMGRKRKKRKLERNLSSILILDLER